MEGYWMQYRKPEQDEKGWFVSETNSKTGEQKKTYYESEVQAYDAFQALIMGRFTARS